MPKMSRRWRNAAIIMAVLGFISFAAKLVIPQYVVAYGGINCPAVLYAQPGYCNQRILFDPFTTLLSGAINSFLWLAIVYVIFLVVYGIRKIVRRS